jgi:hypothetical protein
MALESGMNPNPMQCSSLQSRLICAKCWVEPTILNPEKITNGEFLTITVRCHGETETKNIEKSKLVFTQKFFEQPE